LSGPRRTPRRNTKNALGFLLSCESQNRGIVFHAEPFDIFSEPVRLPSPSSHACDHRVFQSTHHANREPSWPSVRRVEETAIFSFPILQPSILCFPVNPVTIRSTISRATAVTSKTSG